MPFLEIKHLASEHLPAAVELDQLCFGGLWTLEGYQREIDSSNSDLFGLWKLESVKEGKDLATSSPRLPVSLIGIGCFWSILEEAHITILAIHPDYQGQGLGQTLLYALLKSARQRQLERATLEVRASNLAAISLYQKFGFQEAGRRRRYYEDTGEDALILWRGGVHKLEFEQDLALWEREIRDRLNRGLLL